MSIFQNNLLAAAASASAGGAAGGTLWAWGNAYWGALGDGTTTNKCSPVQIGSEENWVNVASIWRASGAVNSDNELYMWGYNGHGQLGLGDTTNRSSPVQVGSLTDWSTDPNHLVVGSSKEMGAIKTDGTLWTWGRNNFGQLGQGNTTELSSPAQVGSDTDWHSIVGGNTCMRAIKTDGTMWFWGYGLRGQNGLGNTTDYSSPVQIGSLTTWKNVSSMEWGAGAVKTDGTIWTWGYNDVGNIGDGTTTNRSSPVQVGSATDWAGPLSGSPYAQHLVNDSGELWFWGFNYENAQAGLNYAQYSFQKTPLQVGDVDDWNAEDDDPSKSISGGNISKVGMKTDRTIWGWGRNTHGEVGDGSTTDRSSPTQIGSDATWQKVCMGAISEHALAIKDA